MSLSATTALSATHPATPNTVTWTVNGQQHSALWRSENQSKAPKRIELVSPEISADVAYRLASEGVGLLWQGDYHQARQLLQALSRRVERKEKALPAGASLKEVFHHRRHTQAQKANVLGKLLLPLTADYRIPLRRAPEVAAACVAAYGAAGEGSSSPDTVDVIDSIVSLRELLGLIGAVEWQKQGVEIPALGGKIYPAYGVFSPIRGEYIDLVAQAPLPQTSPSNNLVFELGVGTGVLSLLMAKRGVAKVVATDLDQRALVCAKDNAAKFGYAAQIELQHTNLFPAGQADVVICNPPWLPAKPSSAIEAAVFDPNSQMLRGFLNGLAAHLRDGGEGWLILSDFAEHLGLRTRAELEGWIAAAGLVVKGRLDARPKHGKAFDRNDPLYLARVAEVTSLWRLVKKS